MNRSFAVLLGGAMMFAATQVPAATLLPTSAERGLGAMRELNVITFGDLTSGHSVEGRTFVGGNVSGGNYGNGSVTTPTQGFKASNRATLTAVGNAQNLTLNNGNNGQTGTKVDAGAVARGQFGGNASFITVNDLPQSGFANIQVGGQFNAQNFNPENRKRAQFGGSAINTNSSPFITQAISLNTLAGDLATQRDQLRLDLQALSAHLKGFGPSQGASVTYANNKLTFNASAVTGSFAVFNIAGTDLAQNGEIFFNLPMKNGSPLTTIINVSGISVMHSINANSQLSSATPSVIWNFFEATTLNLQSSLYGSVLAAGADVTNGGRLNGSVVSRSLKQNAQIHGGTFAGFNVAVVPEPRSWALMIAGFGLVGAALRRRRLITITS